MVALTLAACGGAPSPVDELAASQAAVRAAEEAGADRVDPQAQLYLKLAREGLEKGKAQMETSDNDRASRSLRKALADAELALELARRQTARDEADQAKKVLEKLKPVTP